MILLKFEVTFLLNLVQYIYKPKRELNYYEHFSTVYP
jgi:hypothetical protein